MVTQFWFLKEWREEQMTSLLYLETNGTLKWYNWDLNEGVTESKLTLLTTQQHSEEKRGWGKEYNFIWRTTWLRRWQTNVAK